MYELQTLYCDDTTQIVVSPLEWMQRLAAWVSRPRMHLTRNHGVSAPSAKWRSRIVPAEPIPNGTSVEAADEAMGGRHHIHWVRLLKLVFGIGLKSRQNCGGPLKIIVAIEQPNAIHKILTRWGLPAHPPQRCSTHRFTEEVWRGKVYGQ